MCILTPPFFQQKINVPSNFRAGSVNVGVNEVKVQRLMLMVNASTCMRAAMAFISLLCVTDVCERHG